MLKITLIAFALIIVVILILASTKDRKFNYERSGTINATSEKIFPYISNFKLGKEWNPYDQKDPNIKRTYLGVDGTVGSIMEFAGNSEAGSGKLEILSIIPNQEVQIRLTMTKPISAENLIIYKLTPEGNATKFSWAMSGDSGFLGQLVSVFIDCEKMVTKDFVLGIDNLKQLIEAQK